MALALAYHPISAIRFGSPTRLQESTLLVDAEELRRLLLEDRCLSDVELELAAPGEKCRAGPVFDIIEPRAKGADSSPDFPGVLGPPQIAGVGTTHVLEGTAVTVLRETSPGDSRGATGYVLEMSGPPAAASPYAALCHLLVVPRTRHDLPAHARQKTYRWAGLKAAVYLGRAGLNVAPARMETYDIAGPASRRRPGIPRVAYVGQIFSRQRKPQPEEAILYGLDTDGMLPVVLHPNEWLDGAVLPSYHSSLGGAETYFYQNHPVIMGLFHRQRAGELDFAGTVATIASANNYDRERNCRFAAHLAATTLGADAAVLTKFGGGVPHTDLAETARLLEHAGVKTAVMVTDLARDRRVESALLFNFPEVDAIVCIGGNSTRWTLGRPERVVAASPELAEVLSGPLELESLNVVGVANQQGASRLRAMMT